MGRSVSYPARADWVLYTHLEQDDRKVFVCRKCDHLHYDHDDEPNECDECGNVGFESYPEYSPELQWEDFMDNLTSSFKKSFPSLRACDQWLDHEDHAILENDHAWIGVSEYCGMVSVWCVHKECDGSQYNEEGLHAQWVKSVQRKAERTLEGFADRLVRISFGYPIYERVNLESRRAA